MLSSARISHLFASLALALPIGCTLIVAPDRDQICANDTEICGDGLDNDCDGQVDEGCGCTEGEEQACYSGPAGTKGIGICKEGTQQCESGAWGACVGAVLPATEIVDGQDNDCNGIIDEIDGCQPGDAMPCYTGPPGTEGVGNCKAGVNECTSGKYDKSVCKGQVLPKAELCNGLDDDCNGTIDDGVSKVGEECFPQAQGACHDGKGVYVCQPDGLFCMPNVMPTTEICNAIDDDCNSVIDDGPFCCPDGVQNGDETGIDCGGSCPACPPICTCVNDSACAPGSICVMCMCMFATCYDGMQSGNETDIDCGGSCAQKCQAGQTCLVNADCASGTCMNGICQP